MKISKNYLKTIIVEELLREMSTVAKRNVELVNRAFGVDSPDAKKYAELAELISTLDVNSPLYQDTRKQMIAISRIAAKIQTASQAKTDLSKSKDIGKVHLINVVQNMSSSGRLTSNETKEILNNLENPFKSNGEDVFKLIPVGDGEVNIVDASERPINSKPILKAFFKDADVVIESLATRKINRSSLKQIIKEAIQQTTNSPVQTVDPDVPTVSETVGVWDLPWQYHGFNVQFDNDQVSPIASVSKDPNKNGYWIITSRSGKSRTVNMQQLKKDSKLRDKDFKDQILKGIKIHGRDIDGLYQFVYSIPVQ